MKQCYLDSNFLVYFKNNDADQHKIAVSKLSQLIEEDFDLHISPLVIDEFIYSWYKLLVKKNRDIRLDIIRQMVDDILEIPNLEIVKTSTEKSAQLSVIDLMKEYRLKPRDAYHLLTMKSNSIDTFATFDKDFHKVFASKIISSLI